MYIYISIAKPTDEQIANAIRTEWHMHKKKYLNMISDQIKRKAESIKFFKNICEEYRRQFRPNQTLKSFMSKISNLIWSDILDIQPIVNIKRFAKQETTKRTARKIRAKSRSKNKGFNLIDVLEKKNSISPPQHQLKLF